MKRIVFRDMNVAVQPACARKPVSKKYFVEKDGLNVYLNCLSKVLFFRDQYDMSAA